MVLGAASLWFSRSLIMYSSTRNISPNPAARKFLFMLNLHDHDSHPLDTGNWTRKIACFFGSFKKFGNWCTTYTRFPGINMLQVLQLLRLIQYASVPRRVAHGARNY